MSKQLTIEDLLRFRFIENLSFDPSGNRYAYQVAEIDKKKDTYFRTVYVNKKAYKSDKSTSILSWYDDDHLIISEENKNKNLVFNKYLLLDLVDGKRRTLFQTPLGISSLKVVDPNTFVFSAGIDANDPDAYKLNKEKLEQKKKQLKKEADYEVLDEIPYWFNGVGFKNKKRNALFVCQLKPFSIARITEPLFNVSDAEVKDRRVFYNGSSYTRRMSLFDQVYVYDIDTGKSECLYKKQDHAFSGLFFMKDQLHVLATDGKKYGMNETAKFHLLEDGKLKVLPSYDRTLYESAAVDTALGGGKGRVNQNDILYTLASETDHIELWKIDHKMKKQKLVSMPLISFFDVGRDQIVFCGSDDRSLPELYSYSFKNRKVTKISSFNTNALKDRYLALPKELKYVSDGMELNGWVLLPKDFDRKKKYPAVLDIHGGPRAIYTKAFFHEMQVWANRGYFVLFTNIKGSDGRGDEFADLRGKYGYDDYRNLMDFTDAVLKKYPNIDETKLCETGGSYGGFMSNWIIGHTDRFCCVASQRSIANWPGFTYMSDIGYYFSGDQCGTDRPVRDAEKMWEHSPLKYVDNAKTPTLFIHSDQDYRCPMNEGMQMMQALADRDVETRLVLFHGENHELSRSGKPSHRIRRLKEITDWFDQHTK
jgi:dipeptidyl aminopeptidase/acylaminoacyl peptidase